MRNSISPSLEYFDQSTIWFCSYQKSNRDEPSQLWFCHVLKNLPILFQFNWLYYPFWAWHEIFTFVCFVEVGWFPIRILDNFRFSPIFELSVQMAYPMRILQEDICFVEMGWFPNRILDKFRFSPNFELSVQMAYLIGILEEDICFVEMGWSPNRILDKFRFSPNFELSVQMVYPMRILEEDKAIEVRSEIIRTRLGC